jgi:hypothetical protein
MTWHRTFLIVQVVCLPFIAVGSVLRSRAKEVEKELFYGVVVDAGSSGSRIRMFKWTLSSKVDLTEIVPLDEDEHLFEVYPGLSAHSDEPSEALPALSSLIKAAQMYIPRSAWEDTLFYLKATAGMRLLPTSKATKLMNIVREFLLDAGNCPFKFADAEIISGEEEAVFTYLTANYNLGTLSSSSKPVGALEMGGASMQVIFRPTADIQDHEFNFYMGEELQSVYAKSYIRFGSNDALARMFQAVAQSSNGFAEVASPCHNRGFKEEVVLPSGRKQIFVGSGNLSACTEVVQRLMGLDIECLMPPCAIFGSYMTPVSGKFYAIASFFYTANGLGLVGWKDSKTLSPNAIAKATASYCEKDLETAQRDSGAPMKFAEKYCFLGTYVHQSLLAFGFAHDDSSITFSRKINGVNLGWPAGAMLYETRLMPLSLNSKDSGIRSLCSPVSNDHQIDADASKKERESLKHSGVRNGAMHFLIIVLIAGIGIIQQ